MYYRFISDCMGHMPIIQDNTYTTKLPTDVDEGQFNPSSTTYPVPIPRGAGGDPSETGFAFFALKCRYVLRRLKLSNRGLNKTLTGPVSLSS